MNSVVSRQVVFRLFQVWEAVVFCTAVFAGLVGLQEAGMAQISTYVTVEFYAALVGLVVLWHILLNALELYSSRRLVSRMNEYVGALGAVSLAAGFLALLGAMTGHPTNEAPFLIWFLLTGSGLMVAGRVFARLILRAARAHGRNLRFVTIVGANREAQNLAKELLSTPDTGYRLNAFYDEPLMLPDVPQTLGPARDIATLSHHLMHDPVDEVLIALPPGTAQDLMMEVLEQCRRVGVSARVIWRMPHNQNIRPAAVETIGADTASLLFTHVPSWGWHGRVKTIMDITLASLVLVGIAPLLLLVAAAIKLDSPGPVLFTQTRVGRNKQPFRLYKFRTMVQDAEARQAALEAQNEAGGPVFKIRDDPRITRLGRFLRRSSIDELPQLFNVVLGQMSLVGPRPLPLRDVSKFEKDWHSRRFSVKPGLTCSWVVAGRSELDFDAWVKMDLDYIDNWSLARDVMICLRTVPAVFRGSGAF